MNNVITENAGFIILLFLINSTTIAISYINKDAYLYAYVYASAIFLLSLISTFVINLIPNVKLRNIITLFILTITALPLLLESFVLYNYKALVGAGVINSILETNIKEAWEFIKMYVGFKETLTVNVFLIIGIYFFRNKLWQKFNETGIPGRRIIYALLFSSMAGIGLYPEGMNSIYYEALTPAQRTFSAVSVAYDNMIAYKKLQNQLVNNIVITENKSEIANIVFILGESTNRNHMHQYGYYLENTPYMDLMAKNGDAAIFTNVISPHSTTIAVLSKLFTFCHQESDKPWYEYNNLIDVMNKAGYKTFWLSNQESSGMWGNVAQIYAAHSSWKKFTRIRDSLEDSGVLDEELFPLLDEAMQTQEATKNFYVLHLMGGHGLYYNRYPYSYNRFSDKDIRLEVPTRAKTVVSEYDNALYYNDYIINKIIERFHNKEALVIFLPDHGEAVYDEGNSMIGHIEENSNRNMIEVPLMIWASEGFKKKYPEKWQAINKATTQPYMSDDMIHTIMDIADIKTDEYEAARSIISPSFNAARPRIFNNMDYDKQILLDAKFAD